MYTLGFLLLIIEYQYVTVYFQGMQSVVVVVVVMSMWSLLLLLLLLLGVVAVVHRSPPCAHLQHPARGNGTGFNISGSEWKEKKKKNKTRANGRTGVITRGKIAPNKLRMWIRAYFYFGMRTSVCVGIGGECGGRCGVVWCGAVRVWCLQGRR